MAVATSMKRARLLAALLSSPTLKAAARKAKIAMRTAERIAGSEAFRRDLHEAERVVFDASLARLRGTALRAAGAVEAALKDENPAVTLKAAALVFATLEKADTSELAQRIEELERHHHNNGG